jgi:Leucine-rich repeat (LRR) protein
MQCKIQQNSSNFHEDIEKEELLYLMENFDLKSNELFYMEEVELLFAPKIKSLNNFKIFKNLKVLSIIFPMISQEEEIQIKNNNKSTNINFTSFSLNGIEHVSHSLITLRLVNCNLKEIEKNFTKLKYLENLSLAENQISEIRNLHNCTNLKKLFLYSNNISKIEYLQDCLLLEEIDLSDNQISKIENLDALKNLKILNISANNIENLSNINNIKYITNLSELRFNDENFWPNPVCLNFEVYFQYVMKLKPDLLILDFFNLKQKNFENKTIKEVKNSSISFDYEKFILNSHEIDENLISYTNSQFKEITFIRENLNNIHNAYDKKLEKLEKSLWENNYPLFDTLDLKIEKILNLEMEYYMDNMKKSIISSNEKIENLKSEIKNKENIIFEYLKTLNDIHLYNSGSNRKFLVLQTEYIYEFFKKFFPPFYFESISAVPFIIMKYICNSNNSHYTTNIEQNEFESYVDFCNYEIIIIKDYNLEKIMNIITEIAENKYSSFNYERIKFFRLKEISEKLKLKQERIFSAIFLNKELCVKYIMYFFDMIGASSILSLHEDKMQKKDEEDQIHLDQENHCELNKYFSANIKDTELIEIHNLIEESQSLDVQIKKNEKYLEDMMTDSNEAFDELISMLNYN